MKKWSYLASYSLILFLVASFIFEGWTFFLVPIVIFGLLPLMDFIVGPNTINPNTTLTAQRKNDRFFNWVLWLFVPAQWGIVLIGAFLAANQAWSWWELAGWIFSAGMITGIGGITIAHELGHRTQARDRFLAKALLVAVNYGHFFIEHNQGHHARVATPEDPASARLGESLFAFLPRTLWGSYRHAWQLERRRLTRKKLSFWSFHNQMLVFACLSVMLTVGFTLLWGPIAVLFFLGQSLVSVGLLEMVNYIEHYGLSRQQLEAGKYAKVNPTHSWNADEYISNALLFELQRHSDHHAFPNRPYQILRTHEESPKLPTGYGGMILLAMCPPLWHAIMDPLAKQYTEQTSAA